MLLHERVSYDLKRESLSWRLRVVGTSWLHVAPGGFWGYLAVHTRFCLCALCLPTAVPANLLNLVSAWGLHAAA